MDRQIVLKEDLKKTGFCISKRELSIIKDIAEGKENKEIAVLRGISVKTVETHRHNVMKRLQCNNMPNVIHVLHQQKLLS